MEFAEFIVKCLILGFLIWNSKMLYDLRYDVEVYRKVSNKRWRGLYNLFKAIAVPDELQENSNPVILPTEPAAASPDPPPPSKSDENKESLQKRISATPTARARRKGDDELKRKLGLTPKIIKSEEGE